jgi:hypothetical protein
MLKEGFVSLINKKVLKICIYIYISIDDSISLEDVHQLHNLVNNVMSEVKTLSRLNTAIL